MPVPSASIRIPLAKAPFGGRAPGESGHCPTVASRYRYRVSCTQHRRGASVSLGEVYLDGRFLCRFLRVECHRSHHPAPTLSVGIQFGFVANHPTCEAALTLHRKPGSDLFAVEIWSSLEPPPGKSHDFSILQRMGCEGAITRLRSCSPAFEHCESLQHVELVFASSCTPLPGRRHAYRSYRPGASALRRAHQPAFEVAEAR
ncbi:MAG: hypothetical protein KME03_18115 [Aphanocapsa lilacina HA4352-LM1]|jgi:hypothetical protein|nr:hypothetical protein [Aphanocapsa lilacina HA4352-LM1]